MSTGDTPGRGVDGGKEAAAQARVRVDLAEITPQFFAWLFEAMDSPDQDLADAALANIARLVDALAAADPSFRLTAWRAADVDNLLNEILPTDQLADTHSARWQVAGQAAMFLNFLVGSGLWEGEPGHLAHCNSRLGRSLLAQAPAFPTRQGPQVH